MCEKLIDILTSFYGVDPMYFGVEAQQLADHLISHGVTVQKCCHKAESVISETGLMCTACHSDIDRDAVFCKYCGAKVMPQPPKGGMCNE